jgi:hypothetical protein
MSVAGGNVNCCGPPGVTISARSSLPARCTRPRISRSLPFWFWRVLKRRPLPLRCSSASSLETRLIFHDEVTAISVVMSRLRCQPPQSCVRILHGGADPRRVGGDAEAQAVLRPVRLHLRAGTGRSESRQRGEKTHKRTHRGTLRREGQRVNRGAHESTRLHGAHMAV